MHFDSVRVVRYVRVINSPIEVFAFVSQHRQLIRFHHHRPLEIAVNQVFVVQVAAFSKLRLALVKIVAVKN